MTSPPSSKLHLPSPSKQSLSSSVVSGRTYDAKLVTREMHRLGGTLAHIPAALAPGLAAASASSSSSTLNASSSANVSVGESFWSQLTVHVLPLFNGDPLQSPIEDLNILVRRHIEAVTSRAPSRALATLEMDAIDLIKSGMVTMNVKLSGVDDEKLLNRVIEVWGFFWDQVLPYVEGVLLPLQTHPLLISLHRTPRPHRPSSPTHQIPSPDIPSALNTTFPVGTSNIGMTPPIDVRMLALCAFRDQVIFPISTRLENLIFALPKRDETDTSNDSFGMVHQQPRLQQMLLVLVSQANRAAPVVSLTEKKPPPSPEERAVRSLLDALLGTASLLGLNGQSAPIGSEARPPSFLSQGAPRDRRGRVGGKSKPKMRIRIKGKSKTKENDNEEEDHSHENAYRDETEEDTLETPRSSRYGQFVPTNGDQGSVYDSERERSLNILESLRSPDIETMANATIATHGSDNIPDLNNEVNIAPEERDDLSAQVQAKVRLT